MENQPRTLKDVMPDVMGIEYAETPARKLCDVRVLKEYDATKPSERWPGPQKNVYCWCSLENGKAVGWNESPSHGWSFPVITFKGIKQ